MLSTVPFPRHVSERFEIGEDWSFIVPLKRTQNADTKRIRSETSSMKAEINSVPDIDSVDLMEEDDAALWTVYAPNESGIPLLPIETDKSQLFYGTGYWQSSSNAGAQETPLFPWRQDAVNLADFDVDADTTDTAVSYNPTLGFESAKEPRLIVSHVQQLPYIRRSYLSRSITSESGPGLTEDSARDTASLTLSELQHESEEVLAQSEVIIKREEDIYSGMDYLCSLHLNEACKFDSNQLGERGYGSIHEPTSPSIHHGQDRENRTLTPDRQSAIHFDSTTLAVHSADDDPREERSLENDSSDTDSVWMSDYSEGPPLLDGSHPFLLAKPDVVREALFAFNALKQHPVGTSNSSTSGSTEASTSEKTSGNSSDQKNLSKRERDDVGDDDDEKDTRKRRIRASKQSIGRVVSLACPFAKKDPLKYLGCYAYTIRRIQDVKLHLSRYHQLPIYCRRCKEIFKTEELLTNHSEAVHMCPMRKTPVYEGVNRTHKDQLAKRVSSRMALQDQWFTIFDILFPGHQPRPTSAYVNAGLTYELEGFQAMMRKEGPNIVLQSLRASGLQTTTTNEEHHLETLLLASIADGLELIVQRWPMSRLAPDQAIQEDNTEGPASSNNSSVQAATDHVQSRTSSETPVDGFGRQDSAVPLVLETLLEGNLGDQSPQSRNDAPGQDIAMPELAGESQAPRDAIADIPDPRIEPPSDGSQATEVGANELCESLWELADINEEFLSEW